MTETLPAGIRCIVFDAGETLVDESRLWARYAAQTGVPVFTLHRERQSRKSGWRRGPTD